MGAISDMFLWAATKITGASSLSTPPTWLRMLLGGGSRTAAGVDVDEDTALTYAAVWAAVNVIAGGVGVLPQIVYRRLKPRGKDRDTGHPAYRLLHDRPNPYMDAQVFRETIQAHVCLWGNGYAEIERDGAARPVRLWPLLPNVTEPKRAGSGQLYYETRTPQGTVVPLAAENVLHIRGLGWDGLKGYSVIGYHCESVGVGLATQKFGARFFGNGARPGGVLEHPRTLSEPAAKRLRESWNDIHQGLDNAHRVAILEEGMKWHEMGMPLDDAQFIETQKFGIGNVSRMFQVPLHMLADLDKATFSNIEHQGIEFVTWTLFRWLKKWENEANAKLLAESERSTHFTEFLMDAFLRGDFKTRNEGYAIARQWGWMSKNDVREKENMNPIPDGDSYASLAELQASGKPAPGSVAGGQSASVRQQRVALAFVPVLADAIGRMARKLSNDAGRASRKAHADMSAWCEKYLADYGPAFRSAVMPAIDGAADALWAMLCERPPDAGALAAVARYTAAVTTNHCDAAGRAVASGDDLAALEVAAPAEARQIADGLAALLADHHAQTTKGVCDAEDDANASAA